MAWVISHVHTRMGTSSDWKERLICIFISYLTRHLGFSQDHALVRNYLARVHMCLWCDNICFGTKSVLWENANHKGCRDRRALSWMYGPAFVSVCVFLWLCRGRYHCELGNHLVWLELSGSWWIHLVLWETHWGHPCCTHIKTNPI